MHSQGSSQDLTNLSYLHQVIATTHMQTASCWSCWSQVTLDFGSPDLRDLGRLVTNVYYHFRDFTTLFRVKNSGFLETFAGKIQVLKNIYRISSKHHLFSILSNVHLTIKQNLFHSPKIFQVFEFEVGEEVEVTSRLPVSVLPPFPLLLLLSIPTARVDRDSIACGVPRSLWPPPVLGRWLPAIVHDVQPSSMLFLVMKAIRWL